MNTAPKTIFVCDDGWDVLGVLTVLLQDAGYHVLYGTRTQGIEISNAKNGSRLVDSRCAFA